MWSGRTELTIRGRQMIIPHWVRPGGAAVLYLHGMGSSSSDWIGAVDREDFRGYTLVGFEAPGGLGSFCEAPETLEVDDIAVVAESLIDKLGLAPVSLVGHSLGGIASLLLASARPGRVACFVNIEGNLVPSDCLFSRISVDAPDNGPPGSFYDALEERIRSSGNAGFAAYAEVFRRNMSEPAYRSYSRSVVAYSDHGALLDRFLRLNVPRMFVHGAENTSVPYLDELRQGGIEVQAIQHSHHFPSYSNPEQLFGVVGEFLARHAVAGMGH